MEYLRGKLRGRISTDTDSSSRRIQGESMSHAPPFWIPYFIGVAYFLGIHMDNFAKKVSCFKERKRSNNIKLNFQCFSGQLSGWRISVDKERLCLLTGEPKTVLCHWFWLLRGEQRLPVQSRAADMLGADQQTSQWLQTLHCLHLCHLHQDKALTQRQGDFQIWGEGFEACLQKLLFSFEREEVKRKSWSFKWSDWLQDTFWKGKTRKTSKLKVSKKSYNIQCNFSFLF